MIVWVGSAVTKVISPELEIPILADALMIAPELKFPALRPITASTIFSFDRWLEKGSQNDASVG